MIALIFNPPLPGLLRKQLDQLSPFFGRQREGSLAPERAPLRGVSIRTTLPSMRHMVVIVPELTGYASIRHIAVSLPYASQLIDHVKYMEPQDVKPPDGDTERRRQRAPRAPSMRYLVKLAVKCQSAEELGKRLRRRYQRQQQRVMRSHVTAR
jgi:hypothetical protein